MTKRSVLLTGATGYIVGLLLPALRERYDLRLTTYGSAPARQAIATEMAQAISAQIQSHNLDAANFERIDRITNLCDRIVFDFCFEAPAQGEVRIFPRNDRDEQITVRYRVAGSTIHVDRWPFSVESHAPCVA
jgi:hypothetical protein